MLFRRFDSELLCIEAWGNNGLRVRATKQQQFLSNNDFALLPKKSVNEPEITVESGYAHIVNGNIRCEVFPSGKLRFFNAQGNTLIEEYDRNRFRSDDGGYNSALEICPRTFTPIYGTDNYRLCVRFEAAEEKIFGMGQYQQANIDWKGCIAELAQRNSQVSVPFFISSRGYGFLWNNPAIGKAVFGNNLTEWTAESTKQMDYWITVGDTPAEIERSYAEVTGKIPMVPDYALGFWQSKLRYQTQDELLCTAREYKKRGLPLSVIVADYFHWPHQGDWKFDQKYWPDPSAMVRELRDMGVELMVSVWPTIEEESENFKETEELGYLVRSESGSRMCHLGRACFFDVTNQKARTYLWSKLKHNYYDYGIRLFWLDEAEPEFTHYEYENYRYMMGSDLEIGNIYPKCYSKMLYEGMKTEGEDAQLHLVRCAWAGSQRYGALVWSGDIDSSFRALRFQLAAGLNIGMAGIPLWTTDIGGFHGGNPKDPHFRECLVRWFQFGAFCPVFRLHGCREPMQEPIGTEGGGKVPSGSDNEVWSYGEDVYAICKKYMVIREKLRPYLRLTMKQAHEFGDPVMRTLFYNFPEDKMAWDITDEFFLGDDILVCPVLQEGCRKRSVYLPRGCRWIELETGKRLEGGQTLNSPTPLESIPVFLRETSVGKKGLIFSM